MKLQIDTITSKGYPVEVTVSFGRMDGRILFTVSEAAEYPDPAKPLTDFLLTEEDAKGLKESL